MVPLQHPWQNGPTELISHALEHLHKETDFDQRIAFLLLDVGVETLFKTFLILPVEATQAAGSFGDRKRSAEGNFHQLIHGVDGKGGVLRAAGSRLANYNLHHVEFYHDLRNKLYHQGNGITVPTEKAQEYARIAVSLLKTLLDVDLDGILRQPEIDMDTKVEIRRQDEVISKYSRSIEAVISEIKSATQLAIEKIEPRLLLPSFARSFAAIWNTYSTDVAGDIVIVAIDLEHRLEFARSASEHVKNMISDDSIKSKLFETFDYSSVLTRFQEIPLDVITYELMMNSSDDVSWIHYVVVRQLVSESEEPWWIAFGIANNYRSHVDHVRDLSSSFDEVENYLRELLNDLNKTRDAIEKWALSPNAPISTAKWEITSMKM